MVIAIKITPVKLTRLFLPWVLWCKCLLVLRVLFLLREEKSATHTLKLQPFSIELILKRNEE